MIKVIAFDFGGVLGCDADEWNTTFNEILMTSGLSFDQMNIYWEKHWPKIKIGKEEITEFWNDVGEKNNVNSEILRKIYDNSITINNKVLSLAKKLKNKYKIVILSNDTVDWMNAKRKKFNLENIFYKIYNSGELGFAKPDKKIYKYVLNDLNINADELLFIDNLAPNIKSAKELGINTILFTNDSHTISNIEESY